MTETTVAPETPAPAPAPAVETPVAPATPQVTAPAEPQSILGDAKAPDSKDAKTQAMVVPEKYADFQLPEGTALNKELVDKALPMFKELGLSQEAAQKLVSFHAENVNAEMQARLTDFNKTVEGWRGETMKSLGPEPQKELANAARALDAFGSPELRQFLNQTGLGNNPMLTNMLVKIGKAMGEAKTIEGSRSVPMDPKTESELAMFPSMREQILARNGHR